MLSKFTVGNFLSFQDRQTLSFEAKKQDKKLPGALFSDRGKSLVKSIAVYGANASGKSNLTKAFAFVRNFVLTGLQQSLAEPIKSEPFLLNTETENKPSFFELEISSGRHLFIYGFEVSPQKVHKEWLYQYPNKKLLFKRAFQKIKTNSRHFKEGSAKVIKETRENVLFLSVTASRNGEISKKVEEAIKKIWFISGSRRGVTLDFSFEKFTRDESYRQKIKDFVLQADFGISDIKGVERQMTAEELVKIPPQFAEGMGGKRPIFERKLEMAHKKYNARGKYVEDIWFNFFQESDGTQQFFTLSAPLINSLEESYIVVIDDLDSSLHPLLCRYILKVFNSSKRNSKNAQLVFTTHDTSLLDEELLRRDQVWFTDKNQKGATELFSLAHLRERSSLNFAKRYLEGRYGALPFIRLLEGIK